jgi:hypothetical protein
MPIPDPMAAMAGGAGVGSTPIAGGGSPFPPAGTSPIGTKHVKKKRSGKKKRSSKRRKSGKAKK